MPMTYTACQVRGIYVTEDGCLARAFLERWQPFPPCPRCGGSANWTLVKATR